MYIHKFRRLDIVLRHLHICGPQTSTRNGRGFSPPPVRSLDTPGLLHHGLDM